MSATAKNNFPHQDQDSLIAYYGDPRGRNGTMSPKWGADNLVAWSPPYPIFYSDGKHTPLKTLRFHKKCVGAFDAAFKDALQTLGHDYIKEHRLDVSGGSYCFRVERGGSNLSTHSWGIAIDIDPGHNPFPKKWVSGAGMLDLKFVEIFQKHGITWRGEFGNGYADNDSMHCQAANRGHELK